MDIDIGTNVTNDADVLDRDRRVRIGRFIKGERENLHLTHEALSQKAGGKPNSGHISRIENAKVKANRATLVRLFEALGLSAKILDQMSKPAMIPGTVVFQGMIRILHGIHVSRTIPTRVLGKDTRVKEVRLRSWVRDHWNDRLFNELPLGAAGYDHIWQMLEEHRYVRKSGDDDYIYAPPSDNEIHQMSQMFTGTMVLLISVVYEPANEDDRRQSGAMLQNIAKQFEQNFLSPELAKASLKRFFIYLSKGASTIVSTVMPYLFLWDQSLDKEAYKAFGCEPGSEEAGRGLLLYRARVQCLHYYLMAYGRLVHYPDNIEEFQDRIQSVTSAYEEYVANINQPGTLSEVLAGLPERYRTNISIRLPKSDGTVPPIVRARQLIPALQSIPDEYLLVSCVDSQPASLDQDDRPPFDQPIEGLTTTILGGEIDPLFGFQLNSTLSTADLTEANVDYGDASGTTCYGDGLSSTSDSVKEADSNEEPPPDK